MTQSGQTDPGLSTDPEPTSLVSLPSVTGSATPTTKETPPGVPAAAGEPPTQVWGPSAPAAMTESGAPPAGEEPTALIPAGGAPGAERAPRTATAEAAPVVAAPAEAGPGEGMPASPVPDRADSPALAITGRTVIADDVVEKFLHRIVGLCVARTPGVHGLHPGGPEASAGTAITVRLDGDRAELDLSIEVEFGHAVHEVVEQVRTWVVSQARQLLGLEVTSIDVVVADVVFATDD